MALWTTGPGRGELRPETLRPPADGEALVRTLWTGVSRGTETIVARGDVPASEHDRMRAPFQSGDFPFPVKYGYLNIGVVEDGPDPLRGRTVFSLFPHQSRFVAPATALIPVPDGIPARRAVLAGAVETAINVLWDAAPRLGDRVTVIGAGLVGAAVAILARGIPGVEVTLVDVDAAKAALAAALGVRFARPDEAGSDADVVIEASGSAAGLQLGLRTAATDGEVIVASWFGSAAVPLELGADFHSRRLTIRASQVGAVAPSRRLRRTTTERLALAVRMLADSDFDLLLGDTSPWTRLPEVTAALAAGTAEALCHTIDWTGA
ncbi:dehydrogenase [Microbacterium sp. SYP-A9085]|uniref:zinc-dependent alcohol dehydrogenase n=1 Tax=Microbacterium sp. SYP-A9085 TaxID=2664454 RepID=UPI00129BF2F3|nr:zinc-binding alcohol dehydrogenase [Microbacterium sp. SYP-A9085]MRH30086.1 dehydrogenase [Microbacterium sp. SYP-A9085]